MSGKHWTAAEASELVRLYNAGATLRDAAERVGKTYTAARSKASRLRLAGSEYALRGASTDAAVLALLPGRTVPAVAAELGITPGGVRVAVNRLIARGLLAKDGYRGPYRVTRKWLPDDRPAH